LALPVLRLRARLRSVVCFRSSSGRIRRPRWRNDRRSFGGKLPPAPVFRYPVVGRGQLAHFFRWGSHRRPRE